ncbi:MAG: polyisoprenoid-binding protein [Acidobacteria bacterium]|nr:MAG: polyisoprenoid-binding protein [Acidobacteriota bacterium]GIK77324.1 MAG: hypothetical protein BroJett022_10140 [Actinomycetes bacterium]
MSSTAELLATGRWAIDPSSSTVEFAIKHMLVATVRGRFLDFEGTIDRDDGGLAASGAVRAASVDTGEPVRDANLRGPGFFDSGRHPEIRFASESAEPADDGAVLITGPITIAGTTRPLRLLVAVEPDGGVDRVRLRARGVLRRSEFGIESASLLDAGVSDKVDLALDVRARRLDDPPPG